MAAAFEAVGDIVEGAVDIVEDTVDTVGDIAGDTLDAVGGALESVGETLETTVQAALDDPIGTIATVATAVYAPYMLPAVSAGRTLANGGDLGDALTSAAISYVAQGVGDYVGDQLGTAVNYGTDIGSQQTAMLAAQTGDMMGGTLGGTIGNAAASVASGATAAALSGGDVGQAAINALGTYGLRMGVDYTINQAGQAIDSAGKVIADSDGTITSDTVDDGSVAEFGTEGNEFLPQPETSEPSIFSTDGEVAEFGTEDNTFLPEESAKPSDSTVTGDSTFQPDYSLVPQGETPAGLQEGDLGTGLETPTLPTVVVEADADVDYSLVPEGSEMDAGLGLQLPSSPDLEDMGGGQGLTVDVDGGTVGSTGFTPDNAVPVLGDTDSFINDPDVLDTPVIEPGMDEATPELDAILKKSGQYLKNQFTNQLARNIFGSNTGDVRQRFAPNLTSLGGVGGSSIYDLLSGLQFDPGFSDDTTQMAQSSPVDSSISLFDPLGNASWAPQTKIGGLGFAGKYINQDADTYYVNKEQDEKAKALQDVRNQPWLTDEDRERLVNQEAGSPYYDFDRVDYSLSPFSSGLTYAAEGGLMGHNPEFYSEGGASIGNRYVKGRGDGTSDSVPAMLASGEFVIPADVVSGLGNGDNDAGAKVLDSFMEEIRKHKRGGSPRELPPDSKGPLSYLSSAMTKAKRK